MRKSQARPGIRPIRATAAVAVTAAAVVAGTGTPVFAALPDFTLAATTGPMGGGNALATTSTSGITAAAGASPGARFITPTSATCPSTFGTAPATGATATTATVASNTGDVVTFTVPQIAGGSTTYKVCVYAGTVTASALVGASTNFYALSDPATLTLAPNVAGPGQTSAVGTATGIFLSGVTTPASLYYSASMACPSTYSTSGAITTTTSKNAANTGVTLGVPNSLMSGNTYNACVYSGNAATSTLIAKSQYTVSAAGMLSPNVGPSGGNNTVVVSTATSAPFLTNATTLPGAIFTRTDCPNTYDSGAAGVAPSGVAKVTNSRVSIVVPAAVALVPPETQATYKACVYNGAASGTSTLALQPLSYTIAAPVTVTDIDFKSGPAGGGQLVTVTGTGFPTAPDAQISAAIGGAPLTNLRVLSTTKLEGTTSPRAAGAAAVSVTTLAGTKNSTAGLYTYSFGITTSPNTSTPVASAAAGPTLYVTGAGFDSISFDTVTSAYNTAGKGRVFLNSNAWYTAAATAGTFQSSPTVIPVTVCSGVTVISDTELLCSLELGKSLTNATTLSTTPVIPGAYFVTVVTDASLGTLTASQYSNISSGAAFTVANY